MRIALLIVALIVSASGFLAVLALATKPTAKPAIHECRNAGGRWDVLAQACDRKAART